MLIVLLFWGALFTVASDLGWAAQTVLLGIMTVTLGVGLLACRILGVDEDPFLALVTGFTLTSHALLLADYLAPGSMPWVALCLLVP